MVFTPILNTTSTFAGKLWRRLESVVRFDKHNMCVIGCLHRREFLKIFEMYSIGS